MRHLAAGTLGIIYDDFVSDAEAGFNACDRLYAEFRFVWLSWHVSVQTNVSYRTHVICLFTLVHIRNAWTLLRGYLKVNVLCLTIVRLKIGL